MTDQTQSSPSLPLFYRQPRVLHPAQHGGLSLAREAGYGHAAGAHAVPLLAAEIPSACRQLPVVFTTGAHPTPVAVLGLRAGHNALVDADGQWRAGSYIPAYVRRYPFIFVEDEARNELTLCIDEAAAAVVPGSDNPLFDADGQPSATTRSALAFCRDYQAHHLLTREFGDALADAGLLIEQQADITLLDGQRLTLDGFQVVDEAKFKGLSQKRFQQWRTKGWLPLVYAHLLSIGSWASLVDRQDA